jgi:uncharacterized protein (TIGR02001 family)
MILPYLVELIMNTPVVFILGTWLSNVSWIRDNGASDGGHTLEIDVYGGYAGEIGDTGIGYDVGALQYFYPGEMTNDLAAANTTLSFMQD